MDAESRPRGLLTAGDAIRRVWSLSMHIDYGWWALIGPPDPKKGESHVYE